MTTIDQLEAHDIPVTALANGGPVQTKTVVHDVDQLRSLLDLGLDQQGRQAHYQALFDGIAPAATGGPAAAADTGATLSQRIAAHVVGNADLSDEDRRRSPPAFPLTAHVIAAPGPLTVNSKYDLSTPDGSGNQGPAGAVAARGTSVTRTQPNLCDIGTPATVPMPHRFGTGQHGRASERANAACCSTGAVSG